MALAAATTPTTHAGPMVAITEHITRDTYLSSDNVYVVRGEIHVRTGVRLSIGNGTTLLIHNGDFHTPAGNITGKSALIFDTGSRLNAQTLTVRACDERIRVAARADNAGVFFLGSASIAEKDRVSSDYATRASQFRATRILVSYLGHRDPPMPAGEASAEGGSGAGDDATTRDGSAGTVAADDGIRTASEIGGEQADDVDALSVIGVTASEWQIAEVRSEFSGDDGIDIENSDFTLKRLTVVAPTEDGINITSSRVNITQSLSVDMVAENPADDRDLFDMEYDDGQAFLRLLRGCAIRIKGVFGDEMTLVSDDLPQPDGNGDTPYAFDGVLHRGQTFIYVAADEGAD
jgi:hypothetical protein